MRVGSRHLHTLCKLSAPVLAALTLSLFISCGPGTAPVETAQPAAVPTTEPTISLAAPAAAPEPQEIDLSTHGQDIAPATAVVAKVNGHDVTQQQVNDETDRLINRMSGGQVTPDQMPAVRPQFAPQAFYQIVVKEQMTNYAQAQGLTTSASEVQERFAEVTRGMTGEVLDTALSQSGMTREGLETDIRESLVFGKAEDHFKTTLPPPTEEEIKTYFEANKADLHQPEKVQASHILILSSTGTDTPEAMAKKKQELEDIRKQVVDGADFAPIAKDKSQDPGSAARGGDLGFFERGQMVGPFEQAAFSLKPGELSEIVQTEYGYHLIKVTDRTDEVIPTIENSREKIVADLQNKALGPWRDKLYSDANVQDLDPALNRTPPAGMPPSGMPVGG